MGEQVLGTSRVIVIAAKAHVTLFIDIDLEWVPRWDHHPHAYVKLSIHDKHRILDVFLDHPRLLCVRSLVTDYWLHMAHVVILAA